MKSLFTSALLLLALLLPVTATAHDFKSGGVIHTVVVDIYDVNHDGEVSIADVNVLIDIMLGGDSGDDDVFYITDINSIIDIIQGGNVQPEPDFVDLGLPSGTLWATRNVGASSPEDYGDYFAWGETEPKTIEEYNLDTYKWYMSDSIDHGFTKYCVQSNYGYNDFFDNLSELNPEDDAAWAHYPNGRIPTMEQFQELCDNCTWQWTQRYGVKGQLVTGPNGNAIFLPASGSLRGAPSNNGAGSYAYYWSRVLPANYSSHARAMGFSSEGWFLRYDYAREHGFAVRAVRISRADLYIVQPSLDLGRVPVGETGTGELTIVNNNMVAMTLTATVDAPFSLKQDEGSASSITIEVPGNSRCTVTVMFTGTAQGFYDSNLTFKSPALDGGQSVIPVHARAVNTEISEDDYVDLGLHSGTLWATRNVGASSPEDYGDYFAWGETEPKEVYTWDTYKWNNSDDSGHFYLTKYCYESQYGDRDGKTMLDPVDDAACVHYPGGRMPTLEQIWELRHSCTWQWTQRNGVNGLLVTGPNGKTVFLPAGGYRWEDSLQSVNSYGCYWSLSLGVSPAAYSMEFNSDGWQRDATPIRPYGFLVRAVHESPK